MPSSTDELLDRLRKGDVRALSRVITLIENQNADVQKIQRAVFEKTGRAHVIGVTGSPGAGKSTLVDGIASNLRKSGKRVAILAIDPSSPFSGGALLGDRIRMNKATEDDSIFLRSMATRGALGGVSKATLDAIQILDAFGFDTIIVETVGVGQAEVDIVRTAHTCLVVLVPGMGDSVQAFKAGILEIADIFVVNKADRDGADHLQKDLRVLLSIGDSKDGDWKPPIVPTVATTEAGLPELIKHIHEHFDWLQNTGAGTQKKLSILTAMILKIATDTVIGEIASSSKDQLEKAAKLCLERKTDPYSAAKELVYSASPVGKRE